MLVLVQAFHYWKDGRYIESTDDAYVKADSTIIAPKVGGYIRELLVNDNQTVKAGQLLATIDESDLQNAFDDATAGVAAAKAAVAQLDAQIVAQASMIRQADASVTAAAATLSLSHRNDARRREMALVGFGSHEQADNAATDTKAQSANLERLQAAALSARQQVDVLASSRELARARLDSSQAMRNQAELNLGHTRVTAPVDGTVATRTVRVGQFVQPGTQLMALVPLTQVYVLANFKETQLLNVHPGESVRVSIDTFPDQALDAKVDTLAPASGAEFSLLPPDNATGNFTKIVQRIPVKIVFTDVGALAGRLRPGMSVTAAIDTRTQNHEQ
ncbi:HlyD family secretion protein [Pseudomonas yamanorum]|uniref:HlyD family secretion protein n=1 Tax=Pseudomonas yamanorum TaxID=515393 RepID=A0ABU1CXP2_9PSED|nr:HlyD family secretion protein [Pseudomonas yamanorum]MDR0191945.1 HlyD family secretion protein [Pseudomonas yamanorum]